MSKKIDLSAFDDETTEGLDLSAFDDESSSQPTTEIGALQSAAMGLGSSASMGFDDEIAGALSSPIGALKAAGNYLGVTDAADSDTGEYESAKKEYEALKDQASSQNPIAYGAGYVGGMLAPGIGIGGAVAKGAGLGAKVARGAAAGAATGAVEGAGGGEELSDIAEGAVGGAAVGGLLGGVSNLGSAISRLMEKSVKESPRGYLATMNRLLESGKQGIETFGEDVKNKSNEAILKGAKNLREAYDDFMEETGTQISEIAEKYSPQRPVRQLYNNVKSLIEDAKDRATSSDDEQGINAINRTFDKFINKKKSEFDAKELGRASEELEKNQKQFLDMIGGTLEVNSKELFSSAKNKDEVIDLIQSQFPDSQELISRYRNSLDNKDKLDTITLRPSSEVAKELEQLLFNTYSRVNIEPLLQTKTSNPVVNNIKKEISTLTKEVMSKSPDIKQDAAVDTIKYSPKEVRKLVADLRDLSLEKGSTADFLRNQLTKTAFNDYIQDITDPEDLATFKKAMQDYSAGKVFSSNVFPNIGTKDPGKQAKALNEITTYARQAAAGSDVGDFKQLIREEVSNPAVKEALGPSLQALEQSAETKSFIDRINKPTESKLDEVDKLAKKFTHSFGKSLKRFDEAKINSAAEYAKNFPGIGPSAAKLIQQLADPTKQTQALFTINQSPAMKELVRSLVPELGDEDGE